MTRIESHANISLEMIEKLDDKWYQTKILLFKDEGKIDSPNSKTRVWSVISRNNNRTLGQVQWYAQWRRYCFFPAISCIFDQTCMQDISEFCKGRTDEQKLKWKPNRVPYYDTPFVPTLVKRNNNDN